jgi:transposase
MNDMTLADGVYECSCGYQEDRDVHAAKNMIDIAKSCFEDGFVPTEHREVTLTEFKAAITDEIFNNKPGQRNEKITSFKV